MAGSTIRIAGAVFQQLCVLSSKRPWRYRLIAPIATEQNEKPADGEQRACRHEPTTNRTQASHGPASMHAPAAAFRRRTFPAHAATQRRTVALPAVTVPRRYTFGQGRAGAPRRRTGRARMSVACQAARPRLVRPFVLMTRVVGRGLSHRAPPSNACASNPCSTASKASA